MSMVMEMFAHRDYVRILSLIRRKPRRFGQLQKELDLNPTQVDRALKHLRKGLWIIPRVVPSEKGRLLVEYELGRRGEAFLKSFEAFSRDALRRKDHLGASLAGELRSYLQ